MDAAGVNEARFAELVAVIATAVAIAVAVIAVVAGHLSNAVVADRVDAAAVVALVLRDGGFSLFSPGHDRILHVTRTMSTGSSSTVPADLADTTSAAAPSIVIVDDSMPNSGPRKPSESHRCRSEQLAFREKLALLTQETGELGDVDNVSSVDTTTRHGYEVADLAGVIVDRAASAGVRVAAHPIEECLDIARTRLGDAPRKLKDSRLAVDVEIGKRTQL
jgi:hypothetical protein